MANLDPKKTEISESNQKPVWEWSLSDWGEHCKQSKEIVGLLIMLVSAIAGIFYTFYPVKPKLEIGVRSGRFRLPTMVTKKESLTAENDDLTGLFSVDAEFLRTEVRHYTSIELRNVEQKPFKKVLFQLAPDCRCIIVYVDQVGEAHFQPTSKPIKLGEILSGQSVLLEIWSDEELDIVRRPFVSHDDGSESISIPGSRVSEAETRFIREAFGALFMLAIFLLGILTAIICSVYVYHRLFIRGRQVSEQIAVAPLPLTPKIKDRDLGVD